MSAEFRIAQSELFSTTLNDPRFAKIKTKAADYIYPQLRRNPFFGPNIKRLKGELEGFWRYRAGDYRIFYTVDTVKKLVVVH